MKKTILAVAGCTMLSMTLWAQDGQGPLVPNPSSDGQVVSPQAQQPVVPQATPQSQSILQSPATSTQATPSTPTAPNTASTAASGGTSVVLNQKLAIRLEATPVILAMHMPILKHAALVTEVHPQGLAAQHAIQAGNIILAADGRLLASPLELANSSPSNLLVYQDGQPKLIALTMAQPLRSSVSLLTNPSVGQPLTTSLKAVNLNTPYGAVSVAGVNGQYKLNARVPMANGNAQIINQEGTIQQILTAVDSLPDPLRQITQQKIK